MIASPIKIQRGMSRQLQNWRETVVKRGNRLGWKVGFNLAADQQRLHLSSSMVGYLSSELRLVSGGHYPASPNATLLVEPEIAILIGCDIPADITAEQANAAIVAYTAALELVDTTRSVNDDMEEILAGNLFHERVILAETRLAAADYKCDLFSLSLRINGIEARTLDPERIPQDFSTVIIDVANMLAAHGERLQEGDWIITGAAAKPAPVQHGDEISLKMGFLGNINFKITQFV